jgi:hypothetical protein
VDTQLRPLTLKEMGMIRKELEKNGLPNLAKLMVIKCHIPLFCLEENYCPVIQGAVKVYDEKFHEEMKAQLDKEFEKRLSEIRKNKSRTY